MKLLIQISSAILSILYVLNIYLSFIVVCYLFICLKLSILCNAKQNILSSGKHKWHKRALDNKLNFHRANVFQSKHSNMLVCAMHTKYAKMYRHSQWYHATMVASAILSSWLSVPCCPMTTFAYYI